ncbi:MAG: ABC transporter family substrate-binding protein, partial [Mycobacterium sp.]|nr:ABC transporter family substrate-binding protein [Mycobacterium sp.]
MALVLAAGCAADPPPAPQSTQTSQPAAPAAKAAQIIVAIDSIGAGFNPHLLSDQSPVNAAISSLVLPSAFRPVP